MTDNGTTKSRRMQQLKIGVTLRPFVGSLLLPMVAKSRLHVLRRPGAPNDRSEVRYPEFGKRVTELMANAQITASDAAPLVGVSDEMIRRYANGTAKPRDQKMTRLAKLFGVSESELEYGDPSSRIASDAGRVLTIDERTLLDIYVQLPDAAKKVLRARAVELQEAFGKPLEPPPFGKGTQ